ncbi:MAG: cytochrome c [Alphaproteobacteria bacterium]|nr:cytochrome c [Alphaproteobacteria bacterium]MDP6874643.1 cytochrome c [Alphaproteobacteria bacterium]
MKRFGIFAVLLLCHGAGGAAAADQVERGAYLIRAAGCVGCHTDTKGGGAPLAGGLGLKTPFGTFYSPNITPHRETGIGAWSDQDFLAALRHGVRPDGGNYFPVFPYPSYTAMRAEDALAIKAYLFAQTPIKRRNKAHDVAPPFSWRWTVHLWKWLFFKPGPWQDHADRDAQWNRGAYLVDALAHCGECHTARNFMGAMEPSGYLAGTVDGPDGELVPNITSDPETGIGEWIEADIVQLLREGMKPDYDDVQGSMAEAIRDGLAHLTDEDLNAIARYLRTVPPIVHRVARQPKQ